MYLVYYTVVSTTLRDTTHVTPYMDEIPLDHVTMRWMSVCTLYTDLEHHQLLTSV